MNFSWIKEEYASYSFRTELKVEECVNIFENYLKRDPFSSGEARGFCGKINGTNFSLNKLADSRAMWKPVFAGEFIQSDAGTEIIGSFRKDLLAFYLFYLTIYTFLAVGGLLYFFIFNHDFTGPVLIFVMICLISFIFLPIYSSIQRKKQKQEILEFLKDFFKATMVQPQISVANSGSAVNQKSPLQ